MKTIEKTDRYFLQFAIDKQKFPFRSLLFHVLAFLCCFVLISFAAQRVMKPLPHYALPLSGGFMRLGAWLPFTLYSASDANTSLLASSYIEMFLFISLAFAVYAGMALLTWRSANSETMRTVTSFIWLGAVATGLLLVCIPVLLSQDLFVYADYGHAIVAYGANPFFVPPAAVSHDTITSIDNWSFATSAYGPVWMYICVLVALAGGNHPTDYYVIFRLLAFACYLLNIVLINNILRGCPPRTRTLGTLLYAWNPLVLIESCLGAHNDVVLSTCVLLAIFLAQRAEQKNFSQLRNYSSPLLACTLAVLIKFTLLPLIALFLLLLGCKTLGRVGGWRTRWSLALGNVCLAGLIFVAVSFVCYLPLWLGHSVPEIVKSFATPPSALWAENSFLRSIQDGLKVNGYPAATSPFYPLTSLLSRRVFWDRMSAGALACSLLVGGFFIWRVPTVHRLVLVLLAALSVLLVVTPWFYPWYVQWLVTLAAAALAGPLWRSGKALLVFVLTFSASAMLTYLDPLFTPLGRSLDTRVFFTIGIPVLAALLAFWLMRRQKWEAKSEASF